MLFLEHLRILGLEVGCSWEDAHDAHRKLIKRWHPDRFTSADAGRAEAELRSKALNRALAELRPFLNSSHYAKRQLGQRVRRSRRAVYNDQSISWASRSGSFPTLNRQVRKAIIPSHVTLITRPAKKPIPQAEVLKREAAAPAERLTKTPTRTPSLSSSGRWKTFVGEMQAKLRNVTGTA